MSLLSETPEPAKTVTVHHTFSNQFRVIHADGSWQSVSESPFIHLLFFTTRLPVPSETVYPVIEGNNNLGPEIISERKLRDGFDREFQVDVVMTKEKAKALAESLLKFIADIP